MIPQLLHDVYVYCESKNVDRFLKILSLFDSAATVTTLVTFLSAP